MVSDLGLLDVHLLSNPFRKSLPIGYSWSCRLHNPSNPATLNGKPSLLTKTSDTKRCESASKPPRIYNFQPWRPGEFIAWKPHPVSDDKAHRGLKDLNGLNNMHNSLYVYIYICTSITQTYKNCIDRLGNRAESLDFGTISRMRVEDCQGFGAV